MADLSASKVDEFLDSLNEAMEIHAQNAIKGLPYNKTELAEVVDITRRDQGWYTVWNGATRYLASSENTTYTIGTKVYVNIPNNDFSNQKTIIGLYTENTEQAIYFKSPLDNYEPCTGNILEDSSVGEKLNGFDNEMSLLANWNISEEFADEEKTNALLKPKSQTIVLYETTSAMSNTRDYDGFKYISISAYFKTLLKELGAISGNYGLRVVLFGTKVFDETKDAVAVERSYALDNTAMVGDLYNFSVYYKQEGLFNIEEFDKIDKLRLEFFQEGNFTTSGENTPIPYKYSMNSESGPYQLINNNIFVKDIAIRFGNDPTGNRDTVRILTVNGLTYDSALDDRMNRKTIELDWVHLDPNTEERVKISNISDARKISDLNNYRIHWYRDSKYTQADLIYQMDQEEEATDQKRQVYNDWKQIEQNSTATQEEKFKLRKLLVSTFNLVKGTDYTGNLDNSFSLLDSPGKARIENALSSKINQTIASDNLAGAFWIAKLDDSTYKSWIWRGFQPDTTQETNKVKVVIEYGPMVNNVFDTSSENYHRVESNELVFNNLREVLVEDKNSEFLINYSDNSNGNYPIYDGVTGNILSRHEVGKERVLTAVLTKKGKSYFNGNETIIWKIPKTNSMIYVPDNYFSDSLLTYNIDKEEKTDQEKNDIALIDQYKDNLITSGVNITKNTTNLDILNNYYETIKNDFNNYYFVKRIGTPGTAVNPNQSYNIKQFYNKACVNNTVFCYVIKNNQVFTTSVTMTFSQHGTCGTDYTFTLGLGPKVDSNWNVVGPPDTALTLGDSYYHEILFNLYNSKNEEIELTDEEKNAIIKAWVNKESKGYYSGLNKATSSAEKNAAEYLDFLTQYKNSKFIRVAIRAQDHSPIGDLRYIILQASIRENVDTNNLGNISFIQLLPVHIRAKGTSWVLNGSDYIIYDDKGTNPSFYNDAYSARQGNEIANHISITKTDSNDNFYPKIDSATNKIVPTPLYINDITENIGIVIRDDNNKVVYMCPLVILQNKYQIPAINSWNGQLKIDTDNNEILASMIGAGHKNRTGNTFSGVLMGDVGVRNGSSVNKTTGLFGYDKGTRVFELNTNGQAYIGASGNGRIYINGDTGTIKSAAREANSNQGTEFNLKENYIDIQGIGDNNNSRVHIETPPEDQPKRPYFYIKSVNGTNLIRIGGKDNNNNEVYYLQTDNYSSANKTGLRLDLANGTLNSYNKVTINGATGSSINFGSGSSINLGNGSSINSSGKVTITGAKDSSITFGNEDDGEIKLGYDNNGGYLTSTGTLKITGDTGSEINFGNGTFKVDGEGKLTASSATITGTIESQSGHIGGWVIDRNSLNSELQNEDRSKGIIIASSKLAGSRTVGNFSTDEWRIWSGGNFGVTSDGTLYASGANISGTISASTINGGTISGSAISGSAISGGTISGSTINGGTINIADGLNIGETGVNFYETEVVTSIAVSSSNVSSISVITGATSDGNGGWTFTRQSIYFPTTITVTGSRTKIYYLGTYKEGSNTGNTSTTGGSADLEPITGGCFVKGTKILMGDLSLKNIEDIVINDTVLSYDEKDHKYKTDKVVTIHTHRQTHGIVDLYLSDGSVIGITTSHPILTEQGWKSLDRWMSKYEHWVDTTDYQVGDIILCANNEKKTIEKIVRREELPNITTYTFGTEKIHTFIADGIIAHNDGTSKN